MTRFTLTIIMWAAAAALAAAGDLATDVASLRTVVQQQASVIQTLQARLTALENQQASALTEVTSVKSTLHGLRSNLTSLSDDVGDVRQHAATQVAFSAHMSELHVRATDSPFVFNMVTLNLGDAYNPRTGIFTAPYSGLYAFHFLVVNDDQSPFMRVALMQGPRTLGVGTVDGGPNSSYDDGSVLTATHLTRGETVYVKRRSGYFSIYGDVICRFSGFLLTADL